jgi:HEAT repeat protein
MSALRNCPVCAAPVQRSDYCCRECGHVLQEVVQLELAFGSRREIQDQFGRFPSLESLFVPSAQAVPEGTLVELRLVLPEPWGIMVVPARVMAMAPTPSTPATPYRLHLKATKVELDKQARLRNLVAGEAPPEAPKAEAASRSYAEPPLVPPPAMRPAPPRPPTFPPEPEASAQEDLPIVYRTWPAPLVTPTPTPPPPPIGTPKLPIAIVPPVVAAPVRPPPPVVAAAVSEELDLDIEELLRPLARSPELPSLGEAEAEELEGPTPWEVRERPPEQVSALLTDFVMRFTRAVSKASYYETGHQAAREAKAGLFDSFRQLIEGCPEVTLLNQSSDLKRSMLVYGVFDEPTDLERVLMRGQADVFVPKLVSWFEGRGFLSLSFKRPLEYDEFYRFVDLLAAPVHAARGEQKDFLAALGAQRIRNISVVFQDDLVSRRKLSWRVAVALSRLKKDLSILPLFEGRSSEQLSEVRLQVFRDVIRPLRHGPMIRELLLNCDLVASEVPDLDQEDLELLVQEAIRPEALPELLMGFAQDVLATLGAGETSGGHQARITRNLARRLARSGHAGKEAVFRQLYDYGLLKLEELPATLRDKVLIEQKVARFLEVAPAHLDAFDRTSTPDLYQKHLDFFQLVFAELLGRFELDIVVRIALLVSKHRAAADPFPGRSVLAGAWVTSLPATPAGSEVIWQLMSTDKVRRESLFTLCSVLGDGGVPLLFKALCECPSRSVRQEICDLLEELKEPTRPFLAAELDKRNLPWYFQRNLLNLLGRVGGDSARGLVERFLGDRHPRVRLEAILAAGTLDPAGAEAVLLWALDDPDPDIRRVSLRQLVQRRSSAPALFEHVRVLLQDLESLDDEARQACGLLATYQAGEGHERAVEVLLELLQEDTKRGLWARLTAKDSEAADALKQAACQALGRLRAKRAVPVLERLSEGRHKSLRQAATQALRAIQAG